jgi:hypothetical protein
VFMRLFNGADSNAQIIYRRMRNYNAIMISELVNDVRESIVANEKYGISMQVQRKTAGNVIKDIRFCDRYFSWNQLNKNEERFL